MRPHRSSVLLGVLAAGLMLTQQACTATGQELSRPVAFTVPAAGDPVLTGKRQVVIRPAPSTKPLDHGPFVVSPAGDKYMIKTVDASCLSVKHNGTVVPAACDPASAGQLFTITPQGPSAYAISNQGEFLQVAVGRGLIAGGPLKTTYTFVDSGPAAG